MPNVDESLGEIRMVLNALYRRLASIEQRVRHLEKPKPMTGTIDGLEGEWTVTPPITFDGHYGKAIHICGDERVEVNLT